MLRGTALHHPVLGHKLHVEVAGGHHFDPRAEDLVHAHAGAALDEQHHIVHVQLAILCWLVTCHDHFLCVAVHHVVRVLLALEHRAHCQHALLNLLGRRGAAQPRLPHPRVRFVWCHGVDLSSAWLDVVVGQLDVKLVHARLDLLEVVARRTLERAKHVE